jgi:hypothetical protein
MVWEADREKRIGRGSVVRVDRWVSEWAGGRTDGTADRPGRTAGDDL